MKYLVTGSAGFIGSHLISQMLDLGHEVTGVDKLTGYYDTKLKNQNSARNINRDGYTNLYIDVADLETSHLHEVDAIVHLAAQPGVRASWDSFDEYVQENLIATHHLATTAKAAGVTRIVFASSSSVYGDAPEYPTTENTLTIPRSPYGVTKLAGESLLAAHVANFGLEVASLRFFTVYGPGQRPDMAIQRLIRSAISGSKFTLFGTGEQRRDFTYVGDVVDACIAATKIQLPNPFEPINIGGSGDISMNQLIRIIENAVGGPVDLLRVESQVGDVWQTGANAAKAEDILGWSARFSIQEGIKNQVAYELEQSFENWKA